MRHRPLFADVIVLGVAMVAVAGLGSSIRAFAGTSSPTPAPAAPDCGTIQTLGPNPPADPSAGDIETCFLDAFQSCQPAMLTLVTRGVDTSLTQTFTVSGAAGSCQIAGTSVSVLVPRGSRTSSFTCASVIQQGGALLIQACGAFGDIAVPGPAGS